MWIKGAISYFDVSPNNSFDMRGSYGGFNLGVDKKFDLGNHLLTGQFMQAYLKRQVEEVNICPMNMLIFINQYRYM